MFADVFAYFIFPIFINVAVLPPLFYFNFSTISLNIDQFIFVVNDVAADDDDADADADAVGCWLEWEYQQRDQTIC